MRKSLALFTAAAVVAAGSTAWAGPKDQLKTSMVGNQALAGNATVNNDTTAITVKQKGCALQISMKGLTGAADGDVIMCIGAADVISPPALNPPGGGNGVLVLGEVSGGNLKIKADMSEIGCGSSKAINFNGDTRCYLDNAAYRAPGGWDVACASVPMLPLANTTADPGKTKGGLTVVVGLCQGAALGDRLPPPPSAEIARQGSLIQ